MRKLTLEALAAWLALAAVSGQACAAIPSGANSVSTMAFRGNGVSNTDNTGMTAPPLVSFTNPAVVPDGVAMPFPDEKVPANGGNRADAAVALLTSAAIDRSATRTRLTTGVRVPPNRYFTAADALRLSVAPGFSLSGTDDFTLGGHGTDLKRRAIFNQNHVVSGLHVLGPTNSGNGLIKAVQTVRNESSVAAISNFTADTKRPAGTAVPVPEPGSWATLLAGLLGVIAIARRRMSL